VAQAGVKNFGRNLWLSIAATSVMVVTLTLILTSYISTNALNATIKTIVNKIDVSVYLKLDTTDAQIKDLQQRLEKVDNVQAVNYVSRKEALEEYKRQNASNQKLLDNLSEADNPLPASLQVKAKDNKKLDPIVNFVNTPDVQSHVLKFSYEGDRKKTIDNIVRISNFLKTTGLVASAIFLVISVLIIFNTIRMAIFTRRNEIEIMQLIGATNWYIRGPFLFEAAMYGVIAAFIAVALGYVVLLAGGPKLASYIDVQDTINYFRNYPMLIICAELLIGIAIGILSSLLAMARYLKLQSSE
jgi:cell division transport system permease protein